MRYSLKLVEEIAERIRGGQLPADFLGKDRDRKLPAIGTFRSWKRRHLEMRQAIDAAYMESSEHLLVELRDLRVELKGELDQGAIKSCEVRQKQLMWLLERFDRARFGQRVALEHDQKWESLVARIAEGRARAELPKPKPLALPPARVLPIPKSEVVELELAGDPQARRRVRRIEADI